MYICGLRPNLSRRIVAYFSAYFEEQVNIVPLYFHYIKKIVRNYKTNVRVYLVIVS